MMYPAWREVHRDSTLPHNLFQFTYSLLGHLCDPSSATLENRDFQNSQRSRQRPALPFYRGPVIFIDGSSLSIGSPFRASLYCIPVLTIHSLATDMLQLATSLTVFSFSKAWSENSPTDQVFPFQTCHERVDAPPFTT